ncbi:hypothetical protein F183_A27670 [Bryobacterales bacterium F-183]|nr:hypothetical protein F183_A27670 [Bryobacterales bacterium F-183]
MCGFAGIFHYAEPNRRVNEELLRAMTAQLSHRGPDADGFFVHGPIGLGHRRLSIVDLSPSGAQPMLTPDGNACIAYNGEFYNHQAYRDRLTARGVSFRGSSDTETLLHTMRELGPDSLEQASGIFGFAYWDVRQHALTLVRDPLGVKQVYFHDDGKRVIFASEIKALLCDPSIRREMDPLAVSEYLHFHTPLFERTFFRGIRQVRAGEWIRFGTHSVRSRQYWRVDDFHKSKATPAEQVEHLKEQLNLVVQDQLMADVPVTAFFSGGIDSTAVAAFASRSGNLQDVFGVHFANQGVVDERPYQEEAARALGLRLHLTTLDGRSFPSDLEKLLFYQDQPVIGPAMLPMRAVSELAATNYKVCLGGQASDEVFGGYARYALGRPFKVIGNWFASTGNKQRNVGGNLSKQLTQLRNLRRLARNVSSLGDWQTHYFESFAKVPLSLWKGLFAAHELCDRDHCRQVFQDETNLSKATDPTDKLQEWDLRTYLTGLFQQDDRMSMSVGLESRVPLADPRLVKHAFHIPVDLKLRRGATKWILREAISDLVPPSVLNRVKIGFDTPVDAWMSKQHASFVRDILLSQQARSRGIWSATGMDLLLRRPHSLFWNDLTWKALNIELWARLFLDTSVAESLPQQESYTVRTAALEAAQPETAHKPEGAKLPNLIREVRELGLGRTASRIGWELKTRAALTGRIPAQSDEHRIQQGVIFAEQSTVAAEIAKLLGPEQCRSLVDIARDAAYGRLTAFGGWKADLGYPLAWHRNPVNGRGFARTTHWSRMYGQQAYAGDIKLAWEAGRFPQCFVLGRASVADSSLTPQLETAVRDQILDFVAKNPLNKGVQWCNGQEVALRLLAWTFAIDTFPSLLTTETSTINKCIVESTHYIEEHLEYAQRSVYNNHLISEAFGMLLGGALVLDHDRSRHWISEGIRILDEEADKQFYPDGAYISQSHNYHRSVLQVYLAAIRLVRNQGQEVPQSWLKALDRSLTFLLAHQNPTDGRLPNYGGNDGAMPLILSSCEYSDFRPTLQAVSAVTRNELLYTAGPWDEMALWLEGATVRDLPRRKRDSTSVSFADTGYHVVRGSSPETFATFRCGSLKDRFSQIDMLHLDVFWRGHNVLVDTGSFLYNGPSEWHTYFYGTGGHNTVRINGLNQMPHIRKFKCLYPTEAVLVSGNRIAASDPQGTQLISLVGEHYAYQRPFRITHRRTVLYDGLESWVIVDDLLGSGEPEAEIFWHGGDFPFESQQPNTASLQTPDGPFHISIFDGGGNPLEGRILCGEDNPPAGWLSRHYATKVPIPLLAAKRRVNAPARFVSVLSPTQVESTHCTGEHFVAVFADGRRITFPHGAPTEGFASPAPLTLPNLTTEKELIRG